LPTARSPHEAVEREVVTRSSSPDESIDGSIAEAIRAPIPFSSIYP
jgi:hypothetical protein